MIGFIALILAFICTIISALIYMLPYVSSAIPAVNARSSRFYNASLAFIAAAALYLGYLILSNQFQYNYVYAYSARDLGLFYKIAAFWAGQEGSLLLWVALHGLFGFLLNRSSNVTAAVMSVYSWLQTGLLLTVLVKSPFIMLNPIPADGAGLNPLLQNPWMVLHPPMLFIGYAGLAVPLAFALGSLIDKDYISWLKKALPWSLLAWAALGLGIFMGGYWAYEVLGWGGYWAWDPVENSSLIPWLITAGLVHFLLVAARRRMLAVRPAYLAAIFSYAAALYGTFLTRSGVLSDFSTHSFAGQGVGTLLAILIMVILTGSLLLLIIRWPYLPEDETEEPLLTRGFITVVGGLALNALALIILFGTSTPLITALLGTAQNLNPVFYNKTSLPLMTCIFLLIIAACIFGWKKTGGYFSHKYLYLIMTVLGLTSAGLGWFFEIRDFMCLITLGLAGFTLGSSLIGAQNYMSKPAVLTHMGLACLIIGVIISSAAASTEIADFTAGARHQLFGKNITYLGEENRGDQGYVQKFLIDARETDVVTRFDKAGKYSVHEPAIDRHVLYDIYLAPSLTHNEPSSRYTLFKGQPLLIEDQGLEIIFTDYGMTNKDLDTPGVYALLDISDGKETQQAQAEMIQKNGNFEAISTTVFDQYEISLLAVSVSEGKIMLEINNTLTSAEQIDGQVMAEISLKPMINLVWLGTILISGGTIWAAWKRKGKNITPRH